MNIARSYEFQSVQEAIAFAEELKKNHGYDLFRGQLHPWSPAPALLRQNREQQEQSQKDLQHFYQWADRMLLLQQFQYDVDSKTAIAQHYHIPTSFLDVTTSPEIAGFFALDGTPPKGSSHSVIFCGRSADIQNVKGIRVVRIEVANLWRLEAQKGFFLAFDEHPNPGIDDFGFVQLLFRRNVPSKLSGKDIYIPDKSMLEIELDQYFGRRSGERLQNALDDLQQKGRLEVTKNRYHSYPGAFLKREFPPANRSWLQISKAWVQRPREEYDSTKIQTLRVQIPGKNMPFDFLKELESQWASFLIRELKDRRPARIQITGNDFSDEICIQINHELDNLWNGLRSLPYSNAEVARCLACFLTLMFFALKERRQVDDIFEELHGASAAVLLSQYGGIIDSGLVSKLALQFAMDRSYLAYLNEYYARKCAEDPLFSFMFLLDHTAIFNFDRFKEIYATQLLPSGLADHFLEHLRGNPLEKAFRYSPTYNPLGLDYFTLYEYAAYSQFAHEKLPRNKLIIFEDMSREELGSDVVAAMHVCFKENKPFRLKFAGFERDKRELWEIPRAKELANQLLEFGCMSILELTTWLDMGVSQFRDPDDEDPNLSLGAFELACLAKDIIQYLPKITYAELKAQLWPPFMELLKSQNELAAAIYEEETLNES